LKILKAIFHHPHFKPAGMDIGGDYSETELSGLLRKLLYLYEKDVRRTASVEEARGNNEEVNINLGKLFMESTKKYENMEMSGHKDTNEKTKDQRP